MILNKKYTISLTKQEIIYLENILNHFIDWMVHDDRIDHGLNMLKYYREDLKDKTPIFILAGKFKRRLRKIVELNSENENIKIRKLL